MYSHKVERPAEQVAPFQVTDDKTIERLSFDPRHQPLETALKAHSLWNVACAAATVYLHTSCHGWSQHHKITKSQNLVMAGVKLIDPAT